MPLDADAAAFVDAVNASGQGGLGAAPPEEARAAYAAGPKPDGEEMSRVENRVVPGPAGDIEVRIYAPSDAPDLPVVAFFHGGGWVVSSVDGHDSLARRIADRSGALVVSVEYRLAPEHPFPAPHDDCFAVTKWLTEHADTFGGDPTRVAVAGDSAGGNLAATVALRCRDEGVPLVFQALIYPCIEPDFERPSMKENAEGYYLTTDSMRWCWDQFLCEGGHDNAYAVPLRATDLRGLAPALVQTAEFDPLRDEGEDYARALEAAGVATTSTRYDGVVHGFVSRWNYMARAELAHDEVAAALKAAFGTA